LFFINKFIEVPTLNQLTNQEKTRKHKKRKGSRARGLFQCPQRKGYCMRVTTMKPKKPNSAIRKIAKVKLTTKKKSMVLYTRHRA